MNATHPRPHRRARYLPAALLPLLAAWTLQETIAVAGYLVNLKLEMILTLYQLAAIPIFLAWYKRSSRRHTTLPSAAARLSANPVILPVTAIGLQFGSHLVLLLEELLMPGRFQEYVEMMDTAEMGTLSLPLILYTVILSPVGEELIFRGLTMDYLEKATGRFWIANLLQAALFGLYHMDLVQGIYAFLIGLAVGYAVRAYGTIAAGMAIHVLINGVGYLLANVEIPDPVFLGMEVLGAGLAAWGLVQMRRIRETTDGKCRPGFPG